MRLVAAVTALVLLTATGTGLAAQLHPLIAGWEQYFKVEWQAGDRSGKPVVYGKVFNDFGMPAANVRLLVEGLDGGGAVTSQRVEWLGGGILEPGMRAYFEVPSPGAAPSYRVSVFAFDWVQMGGGDRD
ncbi:MAG: hypothetical protein ACREM3_04585 [Candidatus Rokuibacteriota bacterium]